MHQAIMNQDEITHRDDSSGLEFGATATLRRDLGAFIPARPGAGKARPFNYRIAPLRWDQAIEKYWRQWDELTALAGKAARL